MTAHSARDYQLQAIGNVNRRWSEGSRAICLVAPTGSGKTYMGSQLALDAISNGRRVLWLAHRTELIKQAAERLRGEGIRYVGIVAPWSDPSPHAPCQVASLQTLAARDGYRPAADLVIPDECHHLLSEEWRGVYSSPEYASAKALGLTATPERSDGKPLGDIFDSIVVAASYSQLIASRHILPCRVYQPPERLRKDLALDPIVAYTRYVPGQKAFCFCVDVPQAEVTAAAFNAASIPAGVIHAKTSPTLRADLLRRFELGDLQVLCNVNVLTEGVDIPIASACILARRCLHITPFLQIVGRILRPYPGQSYATLVDLSGASLKHGLPTEDREYSLEGRGIRRILTAPVRTCPKCGAVMDPAIRECIGVEPDGTPCLYRFVPGVRKPPEYLSLELRAVYAGSETPEPAKRQEWDRLLSVTGTRGIGWAIHQFEETFGHPPEPGWLAEVPEPTRRAEYDRIRKQAEDRGFAVGWAAHKFRAAFGSFPPWAWTRSGGDLHMSQG